MAMVVHNNISATRILNQLNNNTSELGKQLQKVSTGMRIRGAADGASEYAISEKMRFNLRGLNQATANAQTGKSMIDLASFAVNQQVEIMRQIHTIALRASDDAYTDDDRGVLQKEVSQLLDQSEDIARQTTYNGIHLLDQRRITGTIEYFDANAPYRENYNVIAASVLASGPVSDTDTGQTSGVMELDFSSLMSGGALVDLDKVGFSVDCAGCDQFITVRFDTSISASDSKLYMGETGTKHPEPMCYVIGVADATDDQSLVEAIMNGVTAASEMPGGGTLPSTTQTSTKLARAHDITLTYDPTTPNKLTLTKSGPPMTLYNGIMGDMVVEHSTKPEQLLKIQGNLKGSQNTTINLPNTTLAILFPKASDGWEIDPENSDYPTEWSSDYADLTIGEKRQKWHDEVWPYPSRHVLLDPQNCVHTRDKANVFLGQVDQAIKYLLGANTTLGAQSSRMEYMEANLVTSSESLQSSESTIRDADMAKEMVAYTKTNVLTQAAQSMLAQANQNASNVLGLLQ